MLSNRGYPSLILIGVYRWLLVLATITAAVDHTVAATATATARNPNNADNSTSSSALSSSFMASAAATYAAVLPCIKSSWTMDGKDTSSWRFPADAKAHFEDLKARTEKFRRAPVHEYAGYEGPWIENVFIERFLHRPLEEFNGLIPLFIQWIDLQILRGRHFDSIHHELNIALRPDVLYLAISQGDVGLGKIGVAHPNILVLSAGGFGHVPIPLVRGLLDLVAHHNTTYSQDIGFFGTVRQQASSRPEILGVIASEAAKLNLTYRQGQGDSWRVDMEKTRFNLAPRGYGRSSFRFAESIQMGRIPVFLYDDVPWVPYNGSNCSVETFGFIGGLHHPEHDLVSLVGHLKNLTHHEFRHKLRRLASARHWYTYAGVVRQIELFLQRPFHPDGSYLRCQKHPHTERCCDPIK